MKTVLKKRNWYIIAFVLVTMLAIPKSGHAQLVVNNGCSINTLLGALIGGGLQVSNVTLNCDTAAYGTFSGGNATNLGINGGIMLTTGSADSLGYPPGNSGFDVTYCVGTTVNDPDLMAIDPLAVNDPCILEFDIIPSCNQLTISFVFGSEEYPTFVGTSFNDAFGFFISGPNPLGGNYTNMNIATLPGGIPVSINNVNNGNTNTGPCTNCAYYVNNSAGTTIQYNGLTTVLTVNLAMVPCSTYHFKIAIADAGDCSLDSGVFIDYLQCSTALATIPSSVPASCNACDGTASVVVNGGTGPYTYTWLPAGTAGNTPNAVSLCPGTYTCIVTDASQCGLPDTAIVTVNSSSGLSLTAAQTDATCFGECNGSASVTVNSGTGPFTFAWAPSGGNAQTANGLCAGTYTVSVTDSSGCASTQIYTITEPPVLTVTMSANASICAGASTTITATPAGGTAPYTVTWDNSLPNGISNSVTPAATTTYNATVTDANGCNVTDSVTVTISPAPVAGFTASPNGCAPWTFNFTNTTTGATSYLWDFGDPGSGANNTSLLAGPSHTYNFGGSYNVTLIAANASGCLDTITIPNAVTVFPQPVASLTVTNPVLSEEAPTAVFNDLSSGGTNCVTYFGDGDSLIGCNLGSFTHVYGSAGTYTVTMITTNNDGCSDTTEITVVVEPESTIYLPNAFTPNGSGLNDFFLAYGTNINNFTMLVFDRWGNLLFESNDIYKGWDGKFKGQLVQEDVYVWKITYTDSHNKKKKAIGHVTVIR